MRFDWTTLALQLINFAILIWLLQRFLYRPVLRMVDARRAATDDAYAEAGQAQEAAKEALAALAGQRAAIGAERAAALEAASQQMEKEMGSRRAEAQRAADALLAQVREELAGERKAVLDEAHRVAFDLGARIAKRLLAEVPDALRAQVWLDRIDRHLAEMPSTERERLAGDIATGAALRVVTATALASEPAAAWCERLRNRLGQSIRIDWDVDPELIAGAELHFPHATLEFSLRSTLTIFDKETQAHADAH